MFSKKQSDSLSDQLLPQIRSKNLLEVNQMVNTSEMYHYAGALNSSASLLYEALVITHAVLMEERESQLALARGVPYISPTMYTFLDIGLSAQRAKNKVAAYHQAGEEVKSSKFSDARVFVELSLLGTLRDVIIAKEVCRQVSVYQQSRTEALQEAAKVYALFGTEKEPLSVSTTKLEEIISSVESYRRVTASTQKPTTVDEKVFDSEYLQKEYFRVAILTKQKSST